MITTYRYIGEIRMNSDGFQNLTPAEQKKYIIQQFCAEVSSFSYKEKRKDETQYGRIVTMNLDTKRNTIEFSRGAQIDAGACTQYLILKNYASADSNIYATHIGYKSILSFDLLGYIQKNVRKIQWSDPDKADDSIKYLQKIREDFFLEDASGIWPKPELFPDEQRAGFPLQTDLTAVKKYFEKDMDFIPVNKHAFALTIDGKYMHELDEVSSCYLDVLYYHFVDRQFIAPKTKGACHICSTFSNLAKDVSLKQKFYGTTNPYFFDSGAKNRNYTAFSMCQRCYDEVIVGTQYAGTQLSTYLLGLNCIVLPELDTAQGTDEQLINPNNLHAIIGLLRCRSGEEHKIGLGLVRDIQSRLSKFSLFFGIKPKPTSNEYIVNRLIKGISIDSLVEKTENLDQLTLEHHLVDLFNYDYSLSFENLRFLLLPSKETCSKLKPKEYEKINRKINRDMLSLLSTYLYSQSFDYNLLIKSFVDIFSRKLNHLGDQSAYSLNLSPYVMNIYLRHLLNFQQIRGIKSMEENLMTHKPMTTALENSKLLDYFENNAEIYGKSKHAQGLFILGWYISSIENEQRKKGIKRTAIYKLNLRGIPLQKVKSVMAIMDDMRQIWEVYNDPITDAYYRECINGIENSLFSPEEVVFHILSGWAYNSYISIIESRKKESNKEKSQEAEND